MQAARPNVTAQVIAHSYDFDFSTYQVAIKTTVKAANNGSAIANNVDVAVIVKSEDGKIIASKTEKFGTIGPGGSKVQDVMITLSYSDIAGIFYNLAQGKTELKFETQVNVY
jgi:hypothetical protein